MFPRTPANGELLATVVVITVILGILIHLYPVVKEVAKTTYRYVRSLPVVQRTFGPLELEASQSDEPNPNVEHPQEPEDTFDYTIFEVQPPAIKDPNKPKQ